MATTSTPALLCRVHQRLCALPLASVGETMRPLPTEPIAGAPLFVSGLAIIRGAPLPVVDLSRLIADQPATPKRYVTLKSGTQQVALAVEDVIGVRVIEASELKALPPLLHEVGTTLIEAVGAVDSELLLVLKSAHLVPAEVYAQIASRAGA